MKYSEYTRPLLYISSKRSYCRIAMTAGQISNGTGGLSKLLIYKNIELKQLITAEDVSNVFERWIYIIIFQRWGGWNCQQSLMPWQLENRHKFFPILLKMPIMMMVDTRTNLFKKFRNGVKLSPVEQSDWREGVTRVRGLKKCSSLLTFGRWGLAGACGPFLQKVLIDFIFAFLKTNRRLHLLNLSKFCI